MFIDGSTEILANGIFENELIKLDEILKYINKNNDISSKVEQLAVSLESMRVYINSFDKDNTAYKKSLISSINNAIKSIDNKFLFNNDKRLSDARIPIDHKHNISDIKNADFLTKKEADALIQSLSELIPTEYLQKKDLYEINSNVNYLEYKLNSENIILNKFISDIDIPTSIYQLDDIQITNPEENQTLVFEGGVFINKDAPRASLYGGGGNSLFTGMNDTPSSYAGNALKVISINSAENGVEFSALTITDISGHIADISNPHSVTKSQVGLGNVENTALSTWAGSTALTTLGTITTGTWNGTTIAIANGGTGQTTSQGAINALSSVAGATNEYVLTKDTGTGNAIYKAIPATAIGDTITSATEGSVLFAGVGGILQQDNANLFWDDTNNELKVRDGTIRFDGTNLNTFLGKNSGNLTTTGIINTALGESSLQSLTTGNTNTAIGFRSGWNITSGIDNTFIGSNTGRFIVASSTTVLIGSSAGLSSTGMTDCIGIGVNSLANNTAVSSTAIGANSLTNNTTGSGNTGIGASSLKSNTTGVDNLAIGTSALQSNVTGGFNIAIGGSCMASALNSTNNVAIGSASLANTTGSANVGIGANTLTSCTSGIGNIAIGNTSLLLNTTGNNNVAIGQSSLQKNTTGIQNVGVGASSLLNVTVGNSNIAIGFNSCRSVTTATGNLALGLNSMLFTTTGANNTAIGSHALYYNTTQGSNVAIGNLALFFNTGGNRSVAIGDSALIGNTTGSLNIAIGSSVLSGNTTGSNNLGLGVGALSRNVTGGSNVAIGGNSLSSNITGSSNSAIGLEALRFNSSGGSNTAVGQRAGYNNILGSFSTLIGTQSGYNATGSSNVLIGYQAGYNETGSNKLYIANTLTATPLIHGDFTNKNLGFSTTDYAGGIGVQALANATTAPTATPVGGGVMYSSGGALYWKGSAGTITLIAPA